MPIKDLTPQDIEQLQNLASKKILAILNQLEVDTGLPVFNVENYLDDGKTVYVEVELYKN